MLKKVASVVLASFRPSTSEEILGNWNLWRGFSVRQDPLYGRTAPRSAVGTSSDLHSLRPCWTAFLSILQRYSLLVLTLSENTSKPEYYELSIACPDLLT